MMLLNREAIQASLEAAIDIERAQVLNEPYMVALLDYSKFVDSLPWEIVWQLALWIGAPMGSLGRCLTSAPNFRRG